MRINEAYEHEPILPYGMDEKSCQTGRCDKTVVQCVDVDAPVVLTPSATVGTVTVSCQGTPSVTCTTDPSGTSCSVVMTQQVCVTIPIRYGVSLTSGEPTIACAGSAGAEQGGCCGCCTCGG